MQYAYIPTQNFKCLLWENITGLKISSFLFIYGLIPAQPDTWHWIVSSCVSLCNSSCVPSM